MYTCFINLEIVRNATKVMETFRKNPKSELITPIKPCTCNFIHKYCFGGGEPKFKMPPTASILCGRKVKPNKEIVEHKCEGRNRPYRLHPILADLLAGRGNPEGGIFK